MVLALPILPVPPKDGIDVDTMLFEHSFHFALYLKSMRQIMRLVNAVLFAKFNSISSLSSGTNRSKVASDQ